MLRVFAESKETAVGANQLADVRWSAVFDDVELTAAEIRELAKEARPLVRSGGKWVAIDKADLARRRRRARRAQADTTQLTGADMLRLALGLEGTPLAGGISVEGGGWAADLLAAASDVSGEPAKAPEGFDGELRSYQAEALAWLGFLDAAGIGGCLALDMGLGKTPTMLAHLLATSDRGPALVIAPPAVVGNWAAEAAALHAHAAGARAPRSRPRRAPTRSPTRSSDADVVITTYGTAVRDIDAIADVDVGVPGARRGAGDQEPHQRDVAAAAQDRRRARASRSPARRSRTASATCGPSSTSPTPASSGRGRSSSPASRATRTAVASRGAAGRAAARTRCARSTASSCSVARSRARDRRPSCPTGSTSSTTAR